MSEYLPLEKSNNRVKPARTETAQRQADISTPARQPQRAAVTPAVRPAPGTVPFSPLASLQRMLASRQIQAKLTLGPVGDQYEQEADTVAQQVVSRLSNGGEAANQAADQPSAQRQEEDEMQMKPISTLQRQEEDEMQMKPIDSIQRQDEEEEMQMKPISTLQRQDEEEEMQMKPISTLQRQGEEEEMQMKPIDAIQRQDEEEEMQMKPIDAIQRQDEEEEMQMKPIDSIQRQDEEEEMQMKPISTLQRQEVVGADGGEIAPELEQSIQGARSGGQPIADTLRGPMENAFGADFSGVRVHSDSQSDALNQSIQARAFTTGQDVFFRQGEYNPGSSQGQELLAHELTHVVQQNGSAVQQKREE